MSKMDYPNTGETKVTNFKPMLSGKAPDDLSKINYPVLVSPKLDGIRCVIRGGVALSRNLKPIPNLYIQRCLKGLPDGLDGELIVGKPVGNDVWNRSQSGVMRQDGEPDFTYWVFDCLWGDPSEAFTHRYATVCGVGMTGAPCKVVPHMTAVNAAELNTHEHLWVNEGYEGVMIRDPNGLYKYGRSTTKEGGLMKLKRFEDAEAVVTGMVEKYRNENEATKDALGRTKRSSAKAGKTAAGTMGALVCALRTPADDPAHPDHHKTRVVTRFEVGTGFDDAQRAEMWSNSPVGKVVKVKFQGKSPDGVPRFPVFLGFRDARDMSP